MAAPPRRRSFPPISLCKHDGRQSHAVAADLDGTLLVSRSSFPYFMLVAIEAGSFLRGLALLLAAPLVLFLYKLVSEAAGIEVLIFVSLAGIPLHRIQRVSSDVLKRFYAADVREESWRAFAACRRKRVVVTANPSVMVAAFAEECLGADVVLGTTLEVWRGRATGRVSSPGVLVGRRKRRALEREFAGEELPELGLGDRDTDHDFMDLCQEGYMVPPNPSAVKLPQESLVSPAADGARSGGSLAFRPTPLASLLTFLWLPPALLLSLIRLSLLPLLPTLFSISLLGPIPRRPSILLCKLHPTTLLSHILSAALRRPVRCLQLGGNSGADAAAMEELLEKGDVAVCTLRATLRETMALLPEETKRRVVVAEARMAGLLFQPAVAGGERWWREAVLWLMNPWPRCEVEFLEWKEDDLN